MKLRMELFSVSNRSLHKHDFETVPFLQKLFFFYSLTTPVCNFKSTEMNLISDRLRDLSHQTLKIFFVNPQRHCSVSIN